MIAMKYWLALVCLVLLTACGGSPFTGTDALFADAGGELDLRAVQEGGSS